MTVPLATNSARPGGDRDGRGRSLGVGHLRCDGALPDQVVELPVVAVQHALQLARGAERVARRADRLVRLLGVLALALVDAGLLGHGLGAVQRLRLGASRVDRLLRERGRVGAHIGDVAVLVERLRDAHGLAGREAQLAAGLLLQRRGRERRGGLARVGLRLDREHRDLDARRPQLLDELGRGRLVEGDRVTLEVALVVEVATGGDALAVDASEARGEALLLVARGSDPASRSQ